MSEQPPYDATRPQQPYQGGYQQQPAPSGGAGLAIGALVLGIIALLTCWTVIGGVVLGLVALILGIVAARRAKRGRGTGRGMAITGAILGLLGLLLSVALVSLGAAVFFNNGGGTLTSCLKKAGDDQAAQQSCQDEFRRKIEQKQNG